MELVVLGQREFAGHHRRGPRLRAQAARRHGQAPPRSRRQSRCSSPPHRYDSGAVDCGADATAATASASSSSSACSSCSARSRRASCPRSRSGTTTRPSQREVFVNVPTALNGRVLRRRSPIDAVHRRVARVAAGPELRAGRPRRPAHHQEERRAARSATSARGVWMQTLLRDPAAGHHALVHLLRLHRSSSSSR